MIRAALPFPYNLRVFKGILPVMRRLFACLFAECFLLAAAPIAWAEAPATTGEPAARAALAVRVMPPQRQKWVRMVRATGNVMPWQEVIVGAEVAGLRVVELRAQVGDVVKQGQVLARLDREQVEQEVAQAAAQAEEAGAQAKRVRALRGSGAVSQQQVDAALAAEKTAKAQLALLKLRLRRTEVRAPYDGVISAREGVMGMVAGMGAPLFRMLREGRLEWQAQVSARDLVHLHKGMRAEVVNAAGQPVEGKIRQLAPTVDVRTREALVYVDLPADAALRAGEFAEGKLFSRPEQVLAVPQEAVVVRDGFSWVFTLEEGSRVRQRKVETGQRQGNETEIVAGLEPDAQVVTTGAGFLQDGDWVQLAGDMPPAPDAAQTGGAQP